MKGAQKVTPAEIMAECDKQLAGLMRDRAAHPDHAASIDQRIAQIQAIRSAWFASQGNHC